MDLYELSLIKKIIRNFPGNLVDISDRINFIYSPALFIICSILLFVKYIILKPIYCWALPEFSNAWIDYMNNYCWVQSTFDLLPDGNFPPQENKQYHNSNYYQWVHIVLTIQSLLFVFPFILWVYLSKQGGVDMMNKLKSINDHFKKKSDRNFQEDLSNEIATIIVKMLETKITDYRTNYPHSNRLLKIKSTIEKWLCLKFINKRSGNSLIIYYIFIKIIIILISILQIWIMKEFLGNINFTFGIDILNNIINGNTWRNTKVFPRLVGCDVSVRQTGQTVKYSILCVLTINMLIEKIYVLLWFWIVITVLVTICSIIYWSVIILCKTQRENFVFKMLTLSKPIRNKSQENISNDTEKLEYAIIQFVNKFLRFDGIFILRMIGNNCSIYFTSFVVESVWKKYCEKRDQLML